MRWRGQEANQRRRRLFVPWKRLLHHRLPQRFLQRKGQKGVRGRFGIIGLEEILLKRHGKLLKQHGILLERKRKQRLFQRWHQRIRIGFVEFIDLFGVI